VGLIMKLSKLVLLTDGFRKLDRLRIDELAKIRLMAIRNGFWFKVLNRLERGLMTLALKVVKEIHSKVLAKALHSIVTKLLGALESKVSLLMRQVGASLVRKLSLIAQKWGNIFARNWPADQSFVRFLAVMHLNSPKMFKP